MRWVLTFPFFVFLVSECSQPEEQHDTLSALAEVLVYMGVVALSFVAKKMGKNMSAPASALIGGCPLLVGIHHFWREQPPNNGTGLLILGQHCGVGPLHQEFTELNNAWVLQTGFCWEMVAQTQDITS